MRGAAPHREGDGYPSGAAVTEVAIQEVLKRGVEEMVDWRSRRRFGGGGYPVEDTGPRQGGQWRETGRGGNRRKMEDGCLSALGERVSIKRGRRRRTQGRG